MVLDGPFDLGGRLFPADEFRQWFILDPREENERQNDKDKDIIEGVTQGKQGL
jgi:hypothetical protein